MAHKKGGGSSKNGRDSNSQRLGIKRSGGEVVKAGTIIVRQRGTKYRVGKNVRRGKDDTLYASVTGMVKFSTRKLLRFTGQLKSAKVVSVVPEKK